MLSLVCFIQGPRTSMFDAIPAPLNLNLNCLTLDLVEQGGVTFGCFFNQECVIK